jgi:hypothetical protein
MEIHRQTAFGQWRGCLFVQVGATALILTALPGERSWGLELLTPMRWFALRPFHRLTWRKGPS